jgi:hypothetical protein
MRHVVGSGADPAAPRHAASVSTSATVSDQHSQTWPLLPHGDERDWLDDLVRAAAAGCAGVAAHDRRSGIGKSAALDYAVQQATGFRVRRIRAVAAELELPYAGLRLLCAPFSTTAFALPATHRNALAAGFDLTGEPRPEVTVVGLATLDLLTSIAESQPVCLVVDDAHWLDDATVRVLAFVARRIDRYALLILLAKKPGITG